MASTLAERLATATYYVDFRDAVEGVTAELAARPEVMRVGEDPIQGLTRYLLVLHEIDVAVTVGPRRDEHEPLVQCGFADFEPPDEVADYERVLEAWADDLLAAARGRG